MLKGKNNTCHEFMCVAMVDCAMGMFEIESSPTVAGIDKYVPSTRSLIKHLHR